jgi:hypothetical protein
MSSLRVSIFIRTYEGDFEWLAYCLRSIHQNLTDWDEIVVCVPCGQEEGLRPLLTSERLVTCEPFADDYIGQQVSKLQAHRHTLGKFVLFVDSDVVFRPGGSVLSYFADGKPVIRKERYDELSFPDARCWQPVVEDLFGSKPEWEYMRSGGVMLFDRETLHCFAEKFPHIENYARGRPFRSFTEFNYLGFFAEQTHPGLYRFVDLIREQPEPMPHACFWSWGGIDLKVQYELEELGLKPRWPGFSNFAYRLAKRTGMVDMWERLRPPTRRF